MRYTLIMTNEEIEDMAQFIYDRFCEDDDFMQDGKRNDHGVDWCIACNILGKDPYDLSDADLTPINQVEARLVFDRVMPYVEGGWSYPDPHNAIDYLIDQSAYTDYHRARVAKQEAAQRKEKE